MKPLEPLRPGLLILQGNRLEWLAEAVCDWLARHPLAPLESETVLVQSNGMGEWLKMQLAGSHGVCAATTVELPARLLWRAYRAVLGADQVPSFSPLDEQPLTWRLMAGLPTWSREPGFEPLRAFLGQDDMDAARRLQLAQRLADLFDQYQVHRSDWLDDWGRGHDELRTGPGGDAQPVPASHRWQPLLWRRLRATLGPDEGDTSRPAVHARFVRALRDAAPGPGVASDAGESHKAGGTGPSSDKRAFPGLPRRLVLFGTTHVPLQTLEAIAALAAHCQVLMAVPNPCRYHWADTLDGRELWRMQRRRHPLRQGVDLSRVPLTQMHTHGHPLLSAWGRQSRDFVRQLDAFDDAEVARQRFALPKIDLFDDSPPLTLLQQMQAAIRDLMPLHEHPRLPPDPQDRSIAFHVAHGPQREVEVLHDQLLHLLAHPPGDTPLAPRDIVVMVPDIETFAPAIRSVFGQHSRGDARHIPWGIADQKDRGQHPLLVALEWLMRAPQQRFGASEVRAWLEVPAVAARLGLSADDLPLLTRWVEDAGIRWGLDARQRARLGLALEDALEADHHTWAFGLRRMLLGYATGDLPGGDGYTGIEPYPEVAGLEAGLAGTLDHLLQTLSAWWAESQHSRTPAQWAARLRRLLGDCFTPTDTTERALIRALDAALDPWLQACEAAGFDESVDLAVAREAWLAAVDEPGLNRRFRAGGVTFCTLLPMRAIPFEVVCLLGMNDGDYPRRAGRSDIDLMALPGLARPGDRSRRDDDRQLMLDALLSARRVLHVSWSGHSPRDPSQPPPSVLVAQLRDYLRAGWGAAAVDDRTIDHPLQPFSRRYFEPQDAQKGEPQKPLFTYAAEWREAHTAPRDVGGAAQATALASPMAPPAALTAAALADFLRNPVKAFFRQRLRVRFDELEPTATDDEPFASQGIERWALIEEVLGACRRELAEGVTALGHPSAQEFVSELSDIGTATPMATTRFIARQIDRLQRAGRLPLAGPGRRVREDLRRALTPLIERWRSELAEHPLSLSPQPLHRVHPDDTGLVFDDILTGLRSRPDGGSPVWIELSSSRVTVRRPRIGLGARPDKVAAAWVRVLASTASGSPAAAIVIGEGSRVRLDPPPAEEARAALFALMAAWRDGMTGARPWPTAMTTGLHIVDGDGAKARQAYEGNDFGGPRGEGREASLARLFPDFDALRAAEGFEAACHRMYAPLRQGLDRYASAQAWGEDDEDDADD